MFGAGRAGAAGAIFDWELATIGDPLADVGYLTATYAQPGDPEPRTSRAPPSRREPGFPTRAELIARYEERSGRSMSAVAWYATLALWKAAIFLEGSYKRLLAGTTDDPFFKLLDAGVPGAGRARMGGGAWRVRRSPPRAPPCSSTGAAS